MKLPAFISKTNEDKILLKHARLAETSTEVHSFKNPFVYI
jgi:hypothetical protein